MRLLVVEDNLPLLESIVQLLSDEFVVDQASNGEDGLFLAMQNIHDVIVLDVMIPEIDGFEVLRTIRKEGLKIPVLFLTARDSLEDRVRGLDSGGDDYLVKPFQVAELKARIRALLRRSGSLTTDQTIKYRGIELSGKEKEIVVAGEPLKLTAKQYELLEFLIQNKGAILTKEQIYDRVWGFDSDTTIAIVEVFMHHLRKKLEPFGYHTEIKTIRGVGYMLNEE
ncbi:MAG: response regulator transcription factor [Bacillus sp. (in: Bacteria)]|nr:response regulator transcription factor [Bacillus sp. (in: firmicutes)]